MAIDTTTTKYWIERARVAHIGEMMRVFSKVSLPRLAELYLSLGNKENRTNRLNMQLGKK